MAQSGQNAPASKPARRIKRRYILLAIVAVLILIVAGVLYSQQQIVRSVVGLSSSRFVSGQAGSANLKLPAGFRADTFYSGLASPRFITSGPNGTLFVAERGTNSIVALPDPQKTGKATEKVVVVSELEDPTSLVFHNGMLYVGEKSRVSRFTLNADFKVIDRQEIVPDLPSGGGHSTRTVLVGPDGNLYVSIGSSCNNCVESDEKRATVWTYRIDGSNGRLFAKGLRNAVGMEINPWNKQIWVTNNGRDLLGDDLPPETVYALQDGGNYGWPRCHAGDIADPDLGTANGCNGVIAPKVEMQAHSAPLGLTFYNAQQFPAEYHGLYVAQHGSWNRSSFSGYKVVFVPLNKQGEVAGQLQDFATGWQVNDTDAVGRPVGLTVGPDGALYISDDKAGIIYRISYTG